MLLSSFVLLVLGGERAQLEGGIKYVSLNLRYPPRFTWASDPAKALDQLARGSYDLVIVLPQSFNADSISPVDRAAIASAIRDSKGTSGTFSAVSWAASTRATVTRTTSRTVRFIETV